MTKVPEKYQAKTPYWKDEAYLRELYVERGLSLVDIASRIEHDRHRLRGAMVDLGIEIRPAPHKQPDAYKGLGPDEGMAFVGAAETEEEPVEPIDWTEVSRREKNA